MGICVILSLELNYTEERKYGIPKEKKHNKKGGISGGDACLFIAFMQYDVL